MDRVVDELDGMLANLSMDQLDDVIGRMEKMKIHKNRDNDVEGLIMAMGSLSAVPDNQKLNVALEGVKTHKKRTFAKKYKSLSGRKTNLSGSQIDDIFATMDALKGDDDMESVDEDEMMAELDQLGGKKRKRKTQKGGADIFKIIRQEQLKIAKKEQKKKPAKKKTPAKKPVKKTPAKKSPVKKSKIDSVMKKLQEREQREKRHGKVQKSIEKVKRKIK